jgi:hypothetical protein
VDVSLSLDRTWWGLGRTKWGVDAVPNEVRDARLALGRTKKDARQDKVGGTFLNSPSTLLTFFIMLIIKLEYATLFNTIDPS